jgi:hypothetical protein
MNDFPSKIKPDCIAEALLEVRFASEVLSELLLGQLAAGPLWREFKATRLPGADIPQPIRKG